LNKANQQAKAIESLKSELEQRMGLSGELSHSDFLLLAEFVFGQTGVRLSYNTLKRIWGKVKADSQPTVTTLDALARAIGHPSWHSYLLKNMGAEDMHTVEVKKHFTNRQANIKVISAFLFVGLLVFLVYLLKPQLDFNPEKVLFSIENQQGEYPFSALFNYDVSAFPGDSFFIAPEYQTKIYLDHRQKNQSVIFLMPGYYRVAFMRNNDTLQTTEVTVTTPDWVGFYSGKSPQPVDFPFLEMPAGKLQISHSMLENRRLPAEETYWTQFFNIQNYDAETDDLQLSLVTRNNKQQGGLTCQIVQIGLWAENGFAECAFGQKGCSTWLRAQVSEKSWQGTIQDLSAFTLNMDEWQNIAYRLKDKRFTVSANGKTLFETTYKKPLGRFKGFRITCKGSGEIDSIYAQTGDGKVLVSTGFSN
jgi:hypothetical protein